VGSATIRPLHSRERDPVQTEQDAGCGRPLGRCGGVRKVSPPSVRRSQRVSVPTEVSRSQPSYCFRHTKYFRISEKFGSTCLLHLYLCNLVHMPSGSRPLSHCFSFAGQMKRLEGRNVAIRTKGNTSVG
jgi:hypothetical protein